MLFLDPLQMRNFLADIATVPHFSPLFTNFVNENPRWEGRFLTTFFNWSVMIRTLQPATFPLLFTDDPRKKSRFPRVGLISFGQPWAGGRKPVGLVDGNADRAWNVVACDAVHWQPL
jgi:hypothetical protein